MTTSILELDYIEPTRPYSQRELQFTREKVLRSLRIGKTRAHHKTCDHFYYVKDHGRKEKEIKENKSGDCGNCSVCWKFKQTPQHLKSRARNLINAYNKKFFDSPTVVTYEDVDIETSYYKWLYEEVAS